jgi:vancomycin resistance protein YoaR
VSREYRERERAGAGVVLVMLVVLTLLFGGGYVAAYAGSQDKVPRGTRVAGIDVGGRTLVAAAAALQAGLADRAQAPITLDIGTEKTKVTPADAGLGVDYVASVEQAGAGRSWQPERLWDYYTGGHDFAPVVTVSAMTMADYVAGLAAEVGTAPRDGVVRFQDQHVTVQRPQNGRTVDPQQVQVAITAAYLSDDSTARIDLVPAAPTIDEADVQAAVRGFANPAMSGSVGLDFDGVQVHLQPRDYAAALSMRPVNGSLQPHVDAAKLHALVETALGGRSEPVDATVAMIGGRPKVVPARSGIEFVDAQVVAAFTAALTQPEGQRVAPVTAQLNEAHFTTKDARKLRIHDAVSTFSTTYSSRSAEQVSRAVTLLDGTVLMPGATFSFRDVAGSGYGQDVLAATTALFNAAFLAGYGDVEHHAPGVYDGRSPVGRQAVIAGAGDDLRFSVDSPYGVLVRATAAPARPGRPGTVTVTMWSTASWEVTVATSPRTNVVEPATREDDGPGCVATPGRRGFDVDVTRHLHDPADPTRDRDEVVHTTYAPVDAVVCTAS